ncbi:DUF3168 domain-containing protein [Seohaeicola saemankumensis]|uniref:DUF3168 domain-containing protein n=1 Tax=Seohaeicola TaxID=481178 RepID=UPI0035CF23D7
MSYAAAAALQAALFAHLSSAPALAALLDGAIYDALPAGPVPPLYLLLGPEAARDRSDQTARGAEHDIVLTVMTDVAGFQQAKQVAAAVCDVLLDPDLALDRGRLVSLHFLRANARRERSGQRRRIELTFRARLDDI